MNAEPATSRCSLTDRLTRRRWAIACALIALIAVSAHHVRAQAPPIGANAACEPAAVYAGAAQPPGSSFQKSLGRFGPGHAVPPGAVSAHAPCWDQIPTPDLKKPAPAHPVPHDCHSAGAEYSELDFSPDPWLDACQWDGCGELGVYGDKHPIPTQRPWFECFTPLYQNGPWPPSYDWFGPTNPARPKFYVYGDFRTAVANNNNVGDAQAVWANRLNLDIDLWLTATERFHMFWGPLDEGQAFSGLIFDENRIDVDDRLDGFDQNTDTMFFEGDLGYILGGLTGTPALFDLPFAVGLIPLVLQNGIWLEDGFVGAAATIPARNSAEWDFANFDTTLFVGFDELTTQAFPGDDNAKFVGVTTFIERRNAYIELGWAFVDDPADQSRSYHNFGASYTRRYLNAVSNSVRTIINTGQGGPQADRTADGVLLIMENSLISRLPYNFVPYCNLFAGFDSPQPLGRLQGPLKNTGINFETDFLTGYPILDDSANNTYGGALGIDLLGAQFDRQLMIEAAMVQAFGNPADRIAPGDQYALGVRYQRKLNNWLLFRADAMHGWLQNSDDIDGVRVELRHKF